MKYYTIGTVFLIISLITILTSVYYSKLTRPIEIEIVSMQLQIKNLQDKLKINELEYAAHINPEYLERLEKIYFFNKYSNNKEFNIIGIEEFNIKNIASVFNFQNSPPKYPVFNFQLQKKFKCKKISFFNYVKVKAKNQFITQIY